jgi:hypothetical protein
MGTRGQRLDKARKLLMPCGRRPRRTLRARFSHAGHEFFWKVAAKRRLQVRLTPAPPVRGARGATSATTSQVGPQGKENDLRFFGLISSLARCGLWPPVLLAEPQ